MRNLLEYPILRAEVIEVLEEMLREEQDKKICGSVRPLVLKMALDVVRKHEGPEIPT